MPLREVEKGGGRRARERRTHKKKEEENGQKVARHARTAMKISPSHAHSLAHGTVRAKAPLSLTPSVSQPSLSRQQRACCAAQDLS